MKGIPLVTRFPWLYWLFPTLTLAVIVFAPRHLGTPGSQWINSLVLFGVAVWTFVWASCYRVVDWDHWLAMVLFGIPAVGLILGLHIFTPVGDGSSLEVNPVPIVVAGVVFGLTLFNFKACKGRYPWQFR